MLVDVHGVTIRLGVHGVKYDVVSGLVGNAVTLSESVGFSYSLCELIYPKYSAICVEIERAIMKRVDDGGCCSMANDEEENNDEVDRVSKR